MSTQKKRDSQLKLNYKRLSPEAKAPEKAKAGDVGYDLFANKTVTINTGGFVGKVPTGIAFDIPEGYWLKVEDRSGFFSNVHLKTGAGVIDNGYTGEVIVCLLNSTNLPITITKGEKFAQVVLKKLYEADLVEVDSLENTERGDSGFGSTD